MDVDVVKSTGGQKDKGFCVRNWCVSVYVRKSIDFVHLNIFVYGLPAVMDYQLLKCIVGGCECLTSGLCIVG